MRDKESGLHVYMYSFVRMLLAYVCIFVVNARARMCMCVVCTHVYFVRAPARVLCVSLCGVNVGENEQERMIQHGEREGRDTEQCRIF